MMPARLGLWQGLVLGFLCLVFGFGVAMAQELPADLPPQVLMRLSQQLGSASPGALSVVQPQASPLALPQMGPGYPQGGYQQGYGTGGQNVTSAALPGSALEADYSLRAGVGLKQYGYDLFRSFQPSSGQYLAGSVPDDYRLGVGDTLVVTLRGQVSKSVSVEVDRNGQVVLPDLSPIPAAGRRFGDWRADLAAQVAAAYVNTQAFVSLGAVRQISVAVLGEVAAPGMVTLGGFGTVLDALALAGGINKTGTLRHIAIIHADGSRDTLDLYPVIGAISGASQPLSLRDGDRIEVGAIGATAAISGSVVRPGIYELADGGINGGTLLDLGGGALRAIGNRYLRLSLNPDGVDQASESANPARLNFHSSDILIVSPRANAVVGQVYLDGHVRLPGLRSRLIAPSVADLVAAPDTLAEAPYLPFAVLDTTDPETQARHFVPIDLERAMTGLDPVSLRDNDVLIVLGADDIRYLASPEVQAVLTGRPLNNAAALNSNANGSSNASGPNGTSGFNTGVPDSSFATTPVNANLPYGNAPVVDQSLPGTRIESTNEATAGASSEATAGSRTTTTASTVLCRGLQSLAEVLATGDANRFANAVEIAPTDFPNNLACPAIYDRYPTLLPFVLEYAASLSGAVQEPGIYPLTGGVSLSTLVAAAGGLSHDADLSTIEVTHYRGPDAGRHERLSLDLTPAEMDQVALYPGDAVRINATGSDREGGPVTLSGEFVRPGIYDIRRGERLSQVIARAGGLTEDAYPYGAVFTRLAVQEIQREATERSVRELESGLFSAVQHSTGQAGSSAQNAAPLLTQVVADMRAADPLGRVVIEADPAVLEVKPELDLILEPGDTLTMPKRPSFVTVSGEVLNPGSEEFTAGLDVSDYLRRAGGYTQNADQSHVFVIYPNGAAQPVRQSFWNFTPLKIPPGSTIIVPRDTSPYDNLGLATALAQIVGQVAITGASLAVIGR